MSQADLPPLSAEMVLLGAFMRVLLRNKPLRKRRQIIAEMSDLMVELNGSPTHIVRVFPKNGVDAMADARLGAAAYWTAIRRRVEGDIDPI